MTPLDSRPHRAARLALPFAAAAALLLTPAASAQQFVAVESANLASVTPLGGGAYELTLSGDPGPGTRQWFHFAVEDAGGMTLTFVVRDFTIGTPWVNGMTPCVSSSPDDPTSWTRVAPADTSFDDANDDLTFSFTFPDDDAWHFAYSFVYPVSRADALVDDIAASPYASASILTQSLEGRDVRMLEITEGALPGKTGIWIQARQHAAECGASWTCEAFLDWLVGPSQKARAVRRHAVVRVVPMMNPDGVAHGHYRRNLAGLDLNREWDTPSYADSPSVAAVLDELAAFDAAVGLDLFFDLHTSSSDLKNWVYGVDGDAQFDAQERGLAEALHDHHDEFSYAGSSWVADDPGVAKNRVHALWPDALSYTLEQTIHTIPYSAVAGQPVTIARYEAMGVALGETLQAFLGFTTKSWLELPLDLALPGSLGALGIAGSGTLEAGTPFAIELDNAQPDVMAFCFVGLSRIDAPFKGGVLVPSPDLIVPVPTDVAGATAVGGIWPSGIPSAATFWAQWWTLDPTAAAGFASSTGLQGTTP
ncbi:MAG: succinylglutamate desuccinylase/aspartoacylase family protein [Planctomycetes bacterium]|nr:succinylglutamate desuccinylase/aspartoacylase family protein [Planctomycetota bacterium]